MCPEGNPSLLFYVIIQIATHEAIFTELRNHMIISLQRYSRDVWMTVIAKVPMSIQFPISIFHLNTSLRAQCLLRASVSAALPLCLLWFLRALFFAPCCSYLIPK